MTCDRCKREVHAWPLQRSNRCSPKNWAVCIRNDGDYFWAEEKREAPNPTIHPRDDG